MCLDSINPLMNLVVGGDSSQPQDSPQPKDRAMIDEGRATLSAFRTLAPEQLALQRQYNPLYAQAQGETMAAGLAGTLPLFENQIAPSLGRADAASKSYQRTADIGDLSTLGPQAVQAILNSDPATARLLDQLQTQTEGDLANGKSLSPADLRDMQQYYRGGAQGRFTDTGNSGSGLEALFLGQRGRDLQQQRQQSAANVLQLRKGILGDPMLAVTGRPSGVLPASVGYQGQAQQQAANVAGISNADPFSGYASDLYNTNFNAGYANLFNQRNTATAEDAANKQLIGSVISGVLGAAGGAAI